MVTPLARTGFSYNGQSPLDDSKFVPLLDMLIDSFAPAGLSAPAVEQLRWDC
jgi:hypothetical protein